MSATHYTSSDGKITPIAELNNFHLVNALVKAGETKHAIENGLSKDGVLEQHKELLQALKAEVLKRLAPPTV